MKLYGAALLMLAATTAWCGELDFREQELPTRLTVGYAVRLLDMNGDQRLDIVIVDSKRVLWLENPNWNEHVLIEDSSKPFDNVCFAPHDIDGDGRLDFALGADWQFNNSRDGGTIQWITGAGPGQPWRLHPIGTEPTVHRMQFADLDGDRRPELIVAPLKGRNTTPPDFQQAGVRLLSYQIPSDPVAGPWKADVIFDQLHVTHNFQPTDFDGDGDLELLVVSFEGVSLLERADDGTWRGTRIGSGNQQSRPSRGASEIKRGRLASGADYIATIEPWHGNQVVVYTRPAAPRPASGEWLWNRQVLDDQLLWGHGVWCEDLDGDGDQELIIGVRDDVNESARRGLRIYDAQDPTGTRWQRHVIDPGSVAIEDLAAGDLNGDGRPDIVAVGRQTKNVKIYWNQTRR
ncbi:MAG: VCBS repeat-containing protein [Pirellulaceae bacterium]|nr:VCBS repeat-containing protein [Pirellulaceae bacterium]